MDRGPGDFGYRASPEPVSDLSDDEFDARMSRLPPCPGIPCTDEEIAAADLRAEAYIAAGQAYPNAIVGEWLLTWGKPGRKPFKEWLAETHG